MKNIEGKYCKDCKIFTDNIEDSALELIQKICDTPIFENKKIRIMPDVHAGMGIVIGFSSPIGDGVAPSHVGCDIGCSMTTIELSDTLKEEDYQLFEYRVKKEIPMGFDLCEKKISKEVKSLLYGFLTKEYNKARSSWPDMIIDIGRIDEEYIDDMLDRIKMDKGKFYQSIGTVGGGNHFMEYGVSEDGRGFFTVHCGSRNFGVKVFNYWNKIANENKISKEELKAITETIKLTEPDKKKWSTLINDVKNELKNKRLVGYLYDENLKGYLSDMVICQAYAKFNHHMIISNIEKIFYKFKIEGVNEIFTTHNYIDFTDHIIRKGSINASLGNKLIIPFNMRDGLAICVGKGNEDWNCTAPHGAGRIMSRTEAFRKISMSSFKESMNGIYSTSVCDSTIDESPMAYKPMDEIVELIKPTVDILYFIRPRINIKATDGGE